MSEGLRNDTLKRRIYVLAAVSDSDECKRLKKELSNIKNKFQLVENSWRVIVNEIDQKACRQCYNVNGIHVEPIEIRACVFCKWVSCGSKKCNPYPDFQCHQCGTAYHNECNEHNGGNSNIRGEPQCPMGCDE